MSDARIAQVKAMIRAALLPFQLELGEARLFFFGSRVTGEARERSDFDVAVEGQGRIQPSLITRIRDALDELPTLYRVDFVDLACVSEAARSEMLKHVEAIL